MSLLAIDLGTSFIKAGMLDLDHYSIAHVQRIPFPEPIRGLDPLRCEYEPDAILSAVKNLLNGMSTFCAEFEGVVMCTQMSCLVLMDENGKVRSNCLGWRDQRALEPHPSGAGSYYEVLKRRISPQQRRDLGNELPPGAPISFLFWMAEQKQLESNLIPVALADFVLSVLCESRPSVDSTNAMAYELLNLRSMNWHKEVISELGLDKLQWPTLSGHGEVIGYIKLGSRTLPCYTAVGDYQCALAGALLAENELSLNISTGSQVSRLTRVLSPGDYQTRPFFDGTFTNTLSHLPAGRSLNLLVELITEFANAQDHALSDPWEHIAKAASRAQTTDLQVNLGFFPGPCGQRGGISNIREQNLNIGTLFAAAFENMADNYLMCARRIWPELSWSNIVFSGGVARKLHLLRAKIEGRLETKARLCPLEEDTMVGLMALGLAFTGRSKSVEQAMSQLRTAYSVNLV